MWLQLHLHRDQVLHQPGALVQPVGSPAGLRGRGALGSRLLVLLPTGDRGQDAGRDRTLLPHQAGAAGESKLNQESC